MVLLDNLKFSLPLYPDLTPEFIEQELVPYLMENKQNIYDIYFTARMAPFEQDAMGTIFTEEDTIGLISNALIIQQLTGITVSPVFNNKFISPNYNNLQLFIKNFRMLYNMGIRSCTIPFTSWLMFNEIQKEFPELLIKNTVLHALDEPRQVYDAAIAGFDYINLDRNLLRNQDKLKIIDEARTAAEQKLGKKIYLSILYNESCIGNCPIQEEHYLYNTNNNLATQSEVFFKSKMNKISCTEWEKNDKAYGFKKSNVLYDQDYINGLYMIDVFKLHGRESRNVFENSLGIIERFRTNQPINDDFYMLKNKNNVSDDVWNKWKETIKNCNFDCWKCKACDELIRTN
jgi:hypothetical protein